jgi:catechol 2,3-dioxygenase-like lactoylglutathione lyase family enzyme
MADTTTAHRSQATPTPTPCAFHQISVPSRDLAQSRRFFTEVLGGDLTLDEPGRVRVQFGDLSIVMAPQAGGATAPHAEYPHYGFDIAPDDFLPIKQRLEAYGVPTHDPWGRQNRPQALMYFRDPSGNQFELYCAGGFTAVPLRLGARAGGDYVIDFPALCYTALHPPVTPDPERPRHRPMGFSHMTLPVRDMHESKRFLVAVLGGEVAFELPDHVTVKVGGAEIGMAPHPGGWTAPDAEYPHYTFLVKPEDLLPLRERLQAHGVPTTEVWTRDGVDAALYFRDPSGNLWELYCERGFQGPTRRAPSAGGDYVPDVQALNYDAWQDPGR